MVDYPDPEPYVGWSGRRYATEHTSAASLDDGPVEFLPRDNFAWTEDDR